MKEETQQINLPEAKRSLSFFVKCNPPKSTAQASLRIMKRRDGTQFVGKFAKSKGKQVQGELMTLLREHVPQTSFDGPIKLAVQWRYPWRKSETRKNKAKGWMYCDTRPDVDNLLKMFQDCLTRLGFWTDDSQVASLAFEKMWSDTPGISVEIEEV